MSVLAVIVCDGCRYKAEGVPGQSIGSLRDELIDKSAYVWVCGFGMEAEDFCNECKPIEESETQ